MTKSELLEQRAKIDAQIAALEAREPWRAESGDGYYYINLSTGTIFYSTESWHHEDNYRYKTGNYFRTKELAAAAEAKRMKRMPQTLAREFLLDVRDGCGGFARSGLLPTHYSPTPSSGRWEWRLTWLSSEFSFETWQACSSFLATPGVTDALDVLFGGKS